MQAPTQTSTVLTAAARKRRQFWHATPGISFHRLGATRMELCDMTRQVGTGIKRFLTRRRFLNPAAVAGGSLSSPAHFLRQRTESRACHPPASHRHGLYDARSERYAAGLPLVPSRYGTYPACILELLVPIPPGHHLPFRVHSGCVGTFKQVGLDAGRSRCLSPPS